MSLKSVIFAFAVISLIHSAAFADCSACFAYSPSQGVTEAVKNKIIKELTARGYKIEPHPVQFSASNFPTNEMGYPEVCQGKKTFTLKRERRAFCQGGESGSLKDVALVYFNPKYNPAYIVQASSTNLSRAFARAAEDLVDVSWNDSNFPVCFEP